MQRNKKMLSLAFGMVLVAVSAALGAWWYLGMARGCNPPLPRKTITVGNASFDVELATTMAERSCGLSGRMGLAENEGMLFIFGSGSSQSFWMKDMNFPIDMIWISGNAVVGFAQNADTQAGAPLWKLKIYSSPPNVDKVLEAAAGTVSAKNIKVGDNVSEIF